MRIVKANDTKNDKPYDIWAYYADIQDLPPDHFRVANIMRWLKRARIDAIVFPCTVWFKTEADAIFFILGWHE